MDNTKPIQTITLDWIDDLQPPVYHSIAGQTTVETGSVEEICIETATGTVRIDNQGNITVHTTHGLCPTVTPIAGNALKVQI